MIQLRASEEFVELEFCQILYRFLYITYVTKSK